MRLPGNRASALHCASACSVGAMATSATLQVTSDHIVERKVLSIRS